MYSREHSELEFYRNPHHVLLIEKEVCNSDNGFDEVVMSEGVLEVLYCVLMRLGCFKVLY